MQGKGFTNLGDQIGYCYKIDFFKVESVYDCHTKYIKKQPLLSNK